MWEQIQLVSTIKQYNMLYEQFIKWIGYQINDDTSLLLKHTLQEKNIMEFN